MIRRRLLLAVTLFFLGVLALNRASGESNAARFDGDSTSRLALSFQPYSGVGHEAMPVEVLKFDVVVGHNTNLWVREWRLKNRSGKAIVKIRPALFVYSESEPDTLLLRHEPRRYVGLSLGPSEEWPKAPCLPAAKSCHGAFAVLPAREWLRPLAESGGRPEGNYRIALGIDKVWFEDGTIWELGATKDK
jgi:hypothetical protein